MGVTNLWPLFFSITIPMVVLLYILKRKYKEKEISSSLLWMEAYKNSSANTPWEKLKVNIMMFLQILILALIILALMNPYLNFGQKEYKNIIVVIDNTASMSTLYDGEKTRLEEGKEIAEEYIKNSKEENEKYIISYNGGNDYDVVNDFKDITQKYGTGDITNIFSYVRALGEGLEGYEVLVITDKEINLEDINGKVISLGNNGENVGITNLAHKFYDDKIKIIATVKNFGNSDYNGDFSLYGEDNLLDVKSITLSTGESITLNYEYDKFSYKYLKGELSKNDLVALDNVYYDVISEEKEKKVLLITEKNVFLEKSLSNLENISLYKTNDSENIPDEDYDLYIFDNKNMKNIPKSGSILLINPESNQFFNVEEIDMAVSGTSSNEEMPNYLKNMNFALSKYKKIEMPYYGKALLKTGEDVIAFIGEKDERMIGAIGFDIHNSDIALKKEFPLFMYELEEKMINSGILYKNNFNAGDEIIIKGSTISESIKVINPDKSIVEAEKGNSYDSLSSLGLYKVKENTENGEKEELFSINYPSEESILDGEKNLSSDNLKNQNKILRRGFSLSPLILLTVLGFLILEWILYLKGN
ncbi:MAG: BatA domain-containing protein [Clostridium sp.]|nr:BatA domain-containing protein [Clostridium sp.]